MLLARSQKQALSMTNYVTYQRLVDLAKNWHPDSSATQIRLACWAGLPELIGSLEQDMYSIFGADVHVSSAAVSTDNPHLRQGATLITLHIAEEPAASQLLSVDCLPDHGRVLVSPRNTPRDTRLLEGYNRIVAATNFQTMESELRGI